jgi:3-isopropylmalate dehydrogenase
MQLIRDPRQFDVIVTDNLFGDLLSDGAAMIAGSLGMLPSASLGAPDASGRRKAIYEPVHGSAPDIAGTDAANPLGAVLSVAMMLRHSLGLGTEADLLEAAVEAALTSGLRTADIARPGAPSITTQAMGDGVLAALEAAARG